MVTNLSILISHPKLKFNIFGFAFNSQSYHFMTSKKNHQEISNFLRNMIQLKFIILHFARKNLHLLKLCPVARDWAPRVPSWMWPHPWSSPGHSLLSVHTLSEIHPWIEYVKLMTNKEKILEAISCYIVTTLLKDEA